jgi:hypothetical protein
MRHGEHNGVVRVEESNWISADKVVEAITVKWSDFDYEHGRRYPKCFLYSISLQSYVKIPYNILVHHLGLVDGSEGFSVRVERNIVSDRPMTVYVR